MIIVNMLYSLTIAFHSCIFESSPMRQDALILAQFLTMLTPLTLVLLQVFPTLNPGWYYVASVFSGVLSWIAIALVCSYIAWSHSVFNILCLLYSTFFKILYYCIIVSNIGCNA